MRVLVVYCHPNPESLVAAAKDRVLAGLDAVPATRCGSPTCTPTASTRP